MNEDERMEGGGIEKRKYHVQNSIFYFIPSVTVLSLWAAYMLLSESFHLLPTHWEYSLTMLFGSLVAGATSEGGGAVAFPVFTKLLNVPPDIARTFSLAIQTVGMGTASIVIFKYRIPIVPRALVISSISGAVGITLGTFFVAPVLKDTYFKLAFTILTLSFGFVLFMDIRNSQLQRFNDIRFHGRTGIALLIGAGFMGGIFTSIVGTGIDFITFSVLVLYFNVSEKVATPTSVILMAINSGIGFFLQGAVLGNFHGAVFDYWMVCVPVVTFGAPIGALICSKVSRENIIRFLLFLITVEFVTTILLVGKDLDKASMIFSPLLCALLLVIFFSMNRARMKNLRAMGLLPEKN